MGPETILGPWPHAGLEGASVDISDVPKEGRGRGEEGGRGGGGGRRRRGRRGRMALGLGLSVVRWTVGVYAAVVKAHAPHQQLLLDRRLVPELLQPKLVLPLPFRSAPRNTPVIFRDLTKRHFNKSHQRTRSSR